MIRLCDNFSLWNVITIKVSEVAYPASGERQKNNLKAVLKYGFGERQVWKVLKKVMRIGMS